MTRPGFPLPLQCHPGFPLPLQCPVSASFFFLFWLYPLSCGFCLPLLFSKLIPSHSLTVNSTQTIPLSVHLALTLNLNIPLFFLMHLTRNSSGLPQYKLTAMSDSHGPSALPIPAPLLHSRGLVNSPRKESSALPCNFPFLSPQV